MGISESFIVILRHCYGIRLRVEIIYNQNLTKKYVKRVDRQ